MVMVLIVRGPMYEQTKYIEPDEVADPIDIALLQEAVYATREVQKLYESEHYGCALDTTTDSFMENQGIMCVDHKEVIT